MQLHAVLFLAIIWVGPGADSFQPPLPFGPRADAVVPTSTPLVVFYRISERAANSYVAKRRPTWVDDAACLRSALHAFAGERPLVVLVDSSLAAATRAVLDAAVAGGAAEVVEVAAAGGSASASFGAALNLSLNLPADTLVYFAEDDYIYEGGGAGTALREGAALGDYVSLYESPVAYEDWRDHSVWRHDLANIMISRDAAAATVVLATGELLAQQQQQGPPSAPPRQPLGTLHVSASARWRSMVALTMTFAARVSTLTADVHHIRAALRWDMPRDFYMSSKLRAAGRVIVAAVPSFAAHGETNFVGAAHTDWPARVVAAANVAFCPAAAAGAPLLSDGALSALREARALEFEILRCGDLAPGGEVGDNGGVGASARACGVGEDAARVLHTRATVASARAAAFIAALSAVRASCVPPLGPLSPRPPAALFDCVDMGIRLIAARAGGAGQAAGDGETAPSVVAWESSRVGLGRLGALSSVPVRLDWGNDPSWAATLMLATGSPPGGSAPFVAAAAEELSEIAAALADASGHYSVPRVLGYCGDGGFELVEGMAPPALLLHAFPFARPVEVILCDDNDRATPSRAAARMALVALSLCGHLARAKLCLRDAPVDAFVVDGASGVLGLSAYGVARIERVTFASSSARDGAGTDAAPSHEGGAKDGRENERAAAALTARALGCGLLRDVAGSSSSESLAAVAAGLCGGALTCAAASDAVRAAVRGDVALPDVEACLVQGVCQ